MKFKHYAALILLSFGLMAYGKIQMDKEARAERCSYSHAYEFLSHCD